MREAGPVVHGRHCVAIGQAREVLAASGGDRPRRSGQPSYRMGLTACQVPLRPLVDTVPLHWISLSRRDGEGQAVDGTCGSVAQEDHARRACHAPLRLSREAAAPGSVSVCKGVAAVADGYDAIGAAGHARRVRAEAEAAT